MMPDVTCIMPVRLSSPSTEELAWLEEAVTSVFTGRMAVELVMVDDGSTVPLSELAGPMLARRAPPGALRLFRFERSIGLIRSLNFALDRARAPVIARLDADDSWLEGSLERRLQQLSGSDDTALVFGGMLITPSTGKARPELRGFDRREMIRHGSEGLCVVPHCSIVAYTEALRSVGGYEFTARSQHVEDFATWANFVRFFNVSSTGQVEYAYRQHGGSVSAVHAELQQRNTRAIAARFARIGDGRALENYLSARRAAGLASGWSAGVELATAWAQGGRMPLLGALDDLEQIFFDRPLRVDGDHATVLPEII